MARYQEVKFSYPSHSNVSAGFSALSEESALAFILGDRYLLFGAGIYLAVQAGLIHG